ncbi:MAG: DivIVA domain-containing protein [Ruminococcus sp.]|nr:DivIVA domain-containing protein [Ruminococcus sp.]
MSISRSKIEGYLLPVKKGKYYDKAQVDAFLQEIANDADDTLCELSEKKERIRELEQREESIAQALVMVKQLSEQIVAKAKNEAEKIIMESTARQMEAEQEVERLEALKARYRTELEEDIKSMMTKFLQEVRSTASTAETE